MSDIIIQIVFASGNTHYTISSRAFLKKIKRVAALILSVCRNVFASVSSAVETLSVSFCPARRAGVLPSLGAAKTRRAAIAGICAKTYSPLNNWRRRWNTMSSFYFLQTHKLFPRPICIGRSCRPFYSFSRGTIRNDGRRISKITGRKKFLMKFVFGEWAGIYVYLRLF